MPRPRKEFSTVQIRDPSFIKWLKHHIGQHPELEEQDWSKIVANLAQRGASNEEMIPAKVLYELLDKLSGTITLGDIALDIVLENGSKLSREQRDLLPEHIAKHQDLKTEVNHHLTGGEASVQ